MVGQSSIPIENVPFHIQVDTDQAAVSQDVAVGRRTRLLWTGSGCAVLMLIGVSACALLPHASHTSVKPSHFASEVAFNPSLSTGWRPGSAALQRIGPQPASALHARGGRTRPSLGVKQTRRQPVSVFMSGASGDQVSSPEKSPGRPPGHYDKWWDFAGTTPKTPLSERVFLVTGSTDGIGEFTAEQLARQGCTVLVHGRDQAKVDKVVEALRQHNPKIHGFVADLSSLSEVRKLGEEISSQFPVLHGLLNNAGTFAGDYTGKRKETVDGNEYSLAVNVLAPFLLTSLLLENVLASGAGRIILTSSLSSGSQDALSDLQCKKKWSDHRAYELSKLCDAMITMELNARYGNAPKITFNTMDPGTVKTKMLAAGWGNMGIPVSEAVQSFKYLTMDHYQKSSGIGNNYCLGEGEESRMKLWDELVQLTGANYPERMPSGSQTFNIV